MNKIMRLHVSFDGSYSGSLYETLILPLEINGVLFNKLEEKTYRNEVSLGEIAGKHSDCYGDFQVEIIDLDTCNARQVSAFIKDSNFGEFESYFEGEEENFMYEEDYDENKVKELLNSYGIVEPHKWSILTSLVHDKFIEQLEAKYVKSFKEIVVLEEDYDIALALLDENNIKIFN